MAVLRRLVGLCCMLSGACTAPSHLLHRSIAAWLAAGGGAAVGGVLCCRHHARRTALRVGSWSPPGRGVNEMGNAAALHGGPGGGSPLAGVQGAEPLARGVQGGGAPLHLRRLIALPLDELPLPIADACDAIPPWKFYA